MVQKIWRVARPYKGRREQKGLAMGLTMSLLSANGSFAHQNV